MDANPNAGDPVPVTPTPAPGDHSAEVSALKSWVRENAVSLVITVVAVALVVRYLDPIDTLKVVLGLGLIIFIHELGHFLAAKWCDVHVKTFSIGFGPAVPFCSYKWGETTYMVGIIPLGGYVSMIGEGDHGGEDDGEEDPRSFRKKTVGQRMLIISAGVVMNLILGMACFVAAYLHGVQEKPAVVGTVESGSAAWRVGIRADDDIVQIGSRKSPYFDDIRPIVMASQKGEQVPVVVVHAGQTTPVELTPEPLRDEGARFPTLGVTPPSRLTLLSLKQPGFKPVVPGSPAASASVPLEGGDRLVAMTDPDKPDQITPIKPDPRAPDAGPDIEDFYRRMVRLAGQPVTLRVQRGGQTLDSVVQPAYRADLGVRMQMGKVVALRRGGPAEAAGVLAWSEDQPNQGDVIKTVKLPEPGGKQTWFAAGEIKNADPGVTVQKLDPVLLPLELKKWFDRVEAAKEANRTVKVEVFRREGHQEKATAELAVPYDAAYRYDRETVVLPNSPTPLGGLGLAYWVDAVVFDADPSGPAAGKLNPGDTVTAVRFKTATADGAEKAGEWEELKANQWAFAEASFQSRPPFRVDLKVQRKDGGAVEEVPLEGREDLRWPTDDRGLVWAYDVRVQKATDIGDAISLGAWRTARFVRVVYLNLYAMAFGRVSAKTMSGPLTIANVSYRFAGEDFWQFLLFLGMISVNLAVVNFLPIPVLDGGHMVFLLLEKILGRPVPERLFAAAMWVGLALILSLMVFVLVLDIRRLFFGWF
ncbi:site-2 protease family protein [Gemmata sp.]|uniref:site-2 protease family protein n=1 Tax=Gemmata sp. TaxID=1914242 RepID=UPI003F71921A